MTEHLEAAEPALEDVQQQENFHVPAVDVRPVGPVRTQALPARSGVATTVPLGTQPQRVLDADLRRSCATLISTAAWNYMRGASGERCPWPALVPLIVTHADHVYATGTAVLTVITEMYAE